MRLAKSTTGWIGILSDGIQDERDMIDETGVNVVPLPLTVDASMADARSLVAGRGFMIED